ncbi:MAG: hypothetical protein MRY83_17010, partial [Flavobacteriales bacterium]|nr:hypothetical protein [Flavobacteriales bacterium]
MNETKVLNEIPKIKNVAQRTQTYNELFWDSDDENMDEIVKFILNEIPHDKSKNLMTSICKTLLRSYDWQSKLNLELLKNILPQADYDLKLQILKTYKEQDYELEFTAESSRVILDQLIELPLKEDNQYRITSTINLISDLIDDDLEFHQILLGLTERFRRYEIITYTIHANVDKLTLNEDIVKQYWINEYKSHNSNSILHDICFFMRKKNIEVDLRIACSK